MSNTSHQHDEPSSADRLPFESVFGEVLRGWTPGRRSADGASVAGAPGAVRLIWLKHLGRDGAIAERDKDTDDWRSDAPERLHLRAGDILLAAVVSGRPKAALVQESDLPAVAAGSLFVLRPVEPLLTEHARLILAFLRSDTVGALAVGSFQRHLRVKDLKSLRLPGNDLPLSAALADLAAAVRRM